MARSALKKKLENNLVALGRFLAKPEVDNQLLNEDAKKFGVPIKKQVDDIFELHQDAVKPLELFTDSITQMQYVNDIPVGLSYAGVDVLRKAKRLSIQVFKRLLLIEQGFLQETNDRVKPTRI